jgi:autotransporter adhesin
MWYPKKAALRAGAVDGSHWDDANVGQWSVSMGRNTTASGTHSVALNADATASGDRSVATGGGTTASGDISTAMGQATVASGFASTALGVKSTASGGASIATGQDATASGIISTAMGQATTASGPVSTATGANTTASGAASTASGRNTVASGNVSTAMGAETRAIGEFSTAIGHNAEARAPGSFAFGDASTTSSVVAVVANQFVARAAGGFRFLSSSNLTTGCDLENGNFICTGTVSGSSSAALKHEFEPVEAESILEKVAALPIQRWRYLADTADVRHVGPTAEDFRDAFALGADSRTIAMVDADGVNMLAVQALARRTAELRDDNSALRDEVKALRDELNVLLALMGRAH